MPAKGRCRVCEHPKINELAADRRSGATLGAVSLKYDLPKSSIFTHEKRCLGGKRRVPAKPADPESFPDTLLGPGVAPTTAMLRLETLYQSDLLQHQAASIGGVSPDPRNVPNLSVQLRGTIAKMAELEAKLPGEKSPEERLLGHPDFAGAIALVLELLDEYPDAKERVRVGLEERYGEATT